MHVTADTTGPSAEILHRRWWILAVLCTSLLIVMLGNTALNIALPTLARDLGATASQQQWMVDAYSLVFAGLLFTTAPSASASGARASCSSAWCCSAAPRSTRASWPTARPNSSPPGSSWARPGAMIMPATLSILTNVFPREERAKAVAIWAGIAGGGGAIGLLLSRASSSSTSRGPPCSSWSSPSLWSRWSPARSSCPTSRDPEQGQPRPARRACCRPPASSPLVYGLIEAPRTAGRSLETLGLRRRRPGAHGGVRGRGSCADAQPMLDVRLFARARPSACRR